MSVVAFERWLWSSNQRARAKVAQLELAEPGPKVDDGRAERHPGLDRAGDVVAHGRVGRVGLGEARAPGRQVGVEQ